MDAVEKDDFDFDAGRHLDDGLILFGTFDEILADGVGGFASALAKSRLHDLQQERVRPPTPPDRGDRQRLTGVTENNLST